MAGRVIDIRIQRNAEGSWDVIRPHGMVWVASESYQVASNIEEALRYGAIGCTETDEIAESLRPLL